MTDIVQPAPITPLPVPPKPTDTPEEFDAKSFATLDAQVAMVPQVNAAADATWQNAKAGEERALDANQAKNAAEIARGQAQTAATSAGASAAVVGRWDKLVLGPKSTPPTVDNEGQPLLVGAEYYNTTTGGRYSWTGTAWMIGTNVTAGVSSVNGMSGPVSLEFVGPPGATFGKDALMADAPINKLSCYSSTTGAGSDWPNASGTSWWNVFTYGQGGGAARLTQTAQQVLGAGSGQGLIYTRAKHDGGWTAWRSGANAGQQTYTSSQTINKSIFGDATYVWVEAWGGGQSGSAVVVASASGRGGAGGDYVSALIRIADLPTSIDIVIGAGGLGASSTSSSTAGANPGGDTSLGSFVIAPGGSSASLYAGRRGGFPRASTSTPTDINSIDAGGAGGGAFDATTVTPGASLRAGAGGAAVITAAGTAAVGSPGIAPGGGGGAARVNSQNGTATSGAGARGELRIKWW